MIAFDDLGVGQVAALKKHVSSQDVDAFAKLSGDDNPLHMDSDFAQRTHFRRRVVHGMLVASYVSTLVGVHLPGSGALWTQQNFRWRAPVFIDDDLEISLTVTHKSEGTRTLTVSVKAVNQHGTVVMDGEGAVMVLEERRQEQGPSLSERVALVTGSSRGIGAAIALALGRAGVCVVVNYARSAAQAVEVCQSIEHGGGKAIAVRADVTDPDAVAAMVEHARQQFGKTVDVLVNNAGGSISARPFLEMTWDDIQSHIDVQLRGAFNSCKAVIPMMVEQRSGRIVNIGSISTWDAPPLNWTGYALAKSALKSFTRSLAAEFGPKGIRANMVSPGMTETDLIADVPERLRKVQAMQTPLRRLAAPEDVARTVLFLCSEAADFITGADIPVCGGISM